MSYIKDPNFMQLFVKFAVVFVVALFLILLLTPPPCNSCKEGMVDVVQIEYEKNQDNSLSNRIVAGYYQVDSTHMAKIPYGYVVDPAHPTQIVPNTQLTREAQEQKLQAAPKTLPKNGEFLADGYYLLTDTSLGVLPPNMMPKVETVAVTDTNNLSVKYSIGYESEYVYYGRTFPLKTKNNLPAGIYFRDASQTLVSFLPPNKVADLSNGYGYLDAGENQRKFDATSKSYRDIASSYDVEFHESAEELMRKNDIGTSIDASGGIRVKDNSGNWVILPRLDAQASPVYYQPGSFLYGTKNYVPSYSDSVYLSSWTKEPEMKPYLPSTIPQGICKMYEAMPSKIEEQCAKLDANVCASTSCCVLLGGSKCVAGNRDGPTFPGHYSDVALRDKDRYFFSGKCYGNCPKH